MTFREIVTMILLFVLYLALQILLVRNLVLFDYAFCFVYIACILLLPVETSLTPLLLTAFVTGIIVDTFYNTLGIHAAATVLMAYFRPFMIRTQVDQPGQDFRVTEFSLRELGAGRFFRYVFLSALIHHAALFFIEASSITLIVPTLIRVASSALFTTVSIVLIQFFVKK